MPRRSRAPQVARFVVAWSRATDRMTGKVRHVAVWVPRDGGLWGGHQQSLCMRDGLRHVQEWRLVPHVVIYDGMPTPPYLQRLHDFAGRCNRLPVCVDCAAIIVGTAAALAEDS